MQPGKNGSNPLPPLPLPDATAPPRAAGTGTASLPVSGIATGRGITSPCQACGACCAFSREWPRFTLEEDCDLDRIPGALVDSGLGRMRCEGDRCAALVGAVGISTSCAIYAIRPDVCRACEPGDGECDMARRRFGLAPIGSMVA